MKAMRFHAYGGPDVLRYEDVEPPTPGAGEVRLRVAATSFNGVDAGIRRRLPAGPTFPVTLPHTPGIDVAGTVDALGDGRENVTVGDAVVAFLPMTAPDARPRVRHRADRGPGGGAHEHPAPGRRGAANGRAHCAAGALRRRGAPGGAARADQRRRGAVGGYAMQLAKRPART